MSLRLLALGFAILSIAARFAHAEPASSAPEMLRDAELTSVQFANPDLGWAVGDRGVIWHTQDGGRQWALQASPSACRLEAISFVDAENGWAVGGYYQPYLHTSTGVVLRTRDGGKNWAVLPSPTLPALKQVKFFDGKRGWIAGDASPLFPTGVWQTDDGGRTWTPLPKGESLGWTAADFRDPQSGVVAGHGGKAALAAGIELRPARELGVNARPLRRLALQAPVGGWLVGDGGLALTTKDGGLTWTAPQTALPNLANEFDFRALAVHQNHCWIAGAPGTCVFHSPDRGQSWEVQRTECLVPLRSLHFIDGNRGWAVGALGTILATRDGGKTWLSQQTGGQRAALLGIFSQPERVPLPLVSQLAGQEGYLTVIETLTRPSDRELVRGEAITRPVRLHDAIVAACGSQADGAWRFPLPGPGQRDTAQAVLDTWNAQNDGQGLKNLEEHLVRRIRQWRPEVIVTENISQRGEQPLSHLTNQVVLAAVQKAAEPTAYSDQITLVGLTPWDVKKVFSLVEGDRQGTLGINPAQLASRLGKPLGDAAEAGRSLLAADLNPYDSRIGFSLLIDHLPQGVGSRDFFSGINLAPGGEARRRQGEAVSGSLDSLTRMAQKKHNIQSLLARTPGDAAAASAWMGQVNDLTKGLSERHSGEILYQLASRYQEAGQFELAADAVQFLLDKHPQHALAPSAGLWLVQYYASGELAWRTRKSTRWGTQLATFEQAEETRAAQAAAAPDMDEDKAKEEAILASLPRLKGQRLMSSAAPTMKPAERASRAAVVAKVLEGQYPMAYAEGALKFPLAVALRRQGVPRTAEKVLAALAQLPKENVWAERSAAENWISHIQGLPPIKTASATPAAKKPKLDGKLDDDTWLSARPVVLTGSLQENDELATAIAMMYDHEFLYLAVSCRRSGKFAYEPDPKPRTYDFDLAKQDRVELTLDIDRDYTSGWQLAFDHQGRTADACWEDATWNPQWFVASGGDDNYWTAEIAIPWAELAPHSPQTRDVWAIGLQRIVPGNGVRSLAEPTDKKIQPQSLGLMIFEP
jgi:photosystem II stability/assembly factor-like uncharacterized protein